MSESAKPSQVNIPEIIAKVDDMHENNKMREAYEFLLPYKDIEDAEIQWRFARICYQVGKHYEPDKTKAEALATEALEHVDKGIKIDENMYACYKWKGIILSWYSDFKGANVKIEKSYEIRDNFNKAIELNPNDAMSRHLMGRWCFNISEVSWLARSAAKLIFSEPPSSSYEEALKHFLEAEKLKAGFYSGNLLFIGKTYFKIGNKTEAKVWIQKTLDFESQSAEAKEAKAEATQLLGKL